MSIVTLITFLMTSPGSRTVHCYTSVYKATTQSSSVQIQTLSFTVHCPWYIFDNYLLNFSQYQWRRLGNLRLCVILAKTTEEIDATMASSNSATCISMALVLLLAVTGVWGANGKSLSCSWIIPPALILSRLLVLVIDCLQSVSHETPSKYGTRAACFVAVWSLYYWLCPLDIEHYAQPEDLRQLSLVSTYAYICTLRTKYLCSLI